MSGFPIVAFAKCDNYDMSVIAAVNEAVAAIGGWAHFVKRGMKVFVKPNLLADTAPEAAVTTHPEFLRAVLRCLKTCGAKIHIGDSPAAVTDLKAVWQKTGVLAVCEEEQVPLVNLEAAGMTVLERGGFRFGIAKPILEADLIVNLPKVKSHSLTLLTAAVKNFYGTVPGFQKTQLHKEYPQRQMFGRLIRAVAQCMPQSLNLADGIIGMERDGPSNGRPVRLGFVVASSDPFALDMALCKVLCIRPEKVPFLVDLHNKPPYNEIDWRGYRPYIPSFRLPRNGHFYLNILPAGVIKNLAKGLWIRPAFNENCIACGRCVKACPLKALSMPANGHLLLNGSLCVGCCCCHEVCPAGAIKMAPSSALKFLNKIRKFMCGA